MPKKLIFIGETSAKIIVEQRDEECQLCEEVKTCIGVTDNHNNYPFCICKDCAKELNDLFKPTTKK